MPLREVLFEFQQVGNFMKVTAIDPRTLTEVSIQAPAWATEYTMKQNAMRRLEFVMRRKGLLPER